MPRTRKPELLLAAACAAAALLVYLPALGNGFVNWDDDLYVTDNAQVRSLDLAFLRWAWTTFHAANWHPLTWLSHALDVAAWGLVPLGHHLTSVLLHAANTLVVVLLALRLLARSEEPAGAPAEAPAPGRWRLVAAGTAGFLFALHPIHVESVAWISERKDLLFSLFYLLALLTYLGRPAPAPGALPEPGRRAAWLDRRLLSCLLLFGAALLSKPMAVTLPVVLLVLDWYPLDRPRSEGWRRLLLEKVPFAALAVGSAAVTLLAQRAGGAMVSTAAVPLATRAVLAGRALVAYLWMLVAPTGLLPFYPHERAASLVEPASLAAALLVLALTAAGLLLARWQRVWLAAWAAWVVTLGPVLGLVQVGGQAMADRYLYLPSLVPFVLAGLAVAAPWRPPSAASSGAALARRAVPVAAAVVLALLAALTVRQTAIWRSSLALWSEVIRLDPRRAPLAWYNRGQAHMEAGDRERALQDYETALELSPAYHEARYGRALALERLGRVDEAAAEYETVVRLDPSNHRAFNNLGVIQGSRGDLGAALALFGRAIRAAPDYAPSYLNRGITLSLAGRAPEAIDDFSRALALDPGLTAGWLQRGLLLRAMGQEAAAREDLRRACRLGSREACTAGGT